MPIISTLKDLDNQRYDTIIWDISNQSKDYVLKGKPHCNHRFVGNAKECGLCGAFKGRIDSLDFDSYTQKILIELAISPAQNTFIITNRTIHKESTIKNNPLKTPKFTIYTALNRLGYINKRLAQSEVFLIAKCKDSYNISNYFVYNKNANILSALIKGKTLIINPKEQWQTLAKDLDYISDKE